MQGPSVHDRTSPGPHTSALAATRPRRPNAGTNMATRLFAAVESQLDLDLDSNEPASGEESGECPSSVVDFDLLPPTALMRYVQHYKIAVPPEADKARLVRAVEEHFCGTVVDEREVVSSFLCANDRSYDDPGGENQRQNGKKRSYDTPIKKANTARRVPRRAPNSAGGAGYKPTSRAPTYGDMISFALSQLPSNQGTLDEICDLIASQYASQLNQEMESGPRRIPVWKASVRKIINLNYGMRFRRSVAANGSKAVFSFASGKRR